MDLVPVARWAGGIMKGWRRRVQCHVRFDSKARPIHNHLLIKTRDAIGRNQSPLQLISWVLWAFYLLSTEPQWNFPLSDPWISKTLTPPAPNEWCGDVGVCLFYLFCFFHHFVRHVILRTNCTVLQFSQTQVCRGRNALYYHPRTSLNVDVFF